MEPKGDMRSFVRANFFESTAFSVSFSLKNVLFIKRGFSENLSKNFPGRVPMSLMCVRIRETI